MAEPCADLRNENNTTQKQRDDCGCGNIANNAMVWQNIANMRAQRRENGSTPEIEARCAATVASLERRACMQPMRIP